MLRELTIVRNRPAPHHVTHADALQKGLREIGIDAPIVVGNGGVKTKAVACWGWRLGRRLKEAGHEVLVMERGYVGDRFTYTSLGWNGLNGYASFPEAPEDNGARFVSHGGRMKPWKAGGEYILILGQVPNDASLKGLDLLPYCEEWSRVAQREHGLPVHFRQHPDLTRRGLRQQVRNAEISTGKLDEALSGAALCVTFNSNSAVEAILAGVPTVALDQGSMATEVASSDIKTVRRPDREAWASALAWKQWSIEEIESGRPLEKLLRMVPCFS